LPLLFHPNLLLAAVWSGRVNRALFDNMADFLKWHGQETGHSSLKLTLAQPTLLWYNVFRQIFKTS